MFFIVAGLALAVVAVVLMRGAHPLAVGLVVFTLLAAGVAGIAIVGVLGPLVGLVSPRGATIGGRTRVALERDKALTLRAIKELEFDRAMGKVSEPDFLEMRDRLRQRALRLMRQFEGVGVYRSMIERDVAAKTGQSSEALPALATAAAPPAPAPGACEQCGSGNDPDARFCKACGHRLSLAAGSHA
jgi:hypothetical protein